jgi:cobalamin biosynthesis protein CobT
VIHVSAVLNGQQLFQERGRLARSTLSHQPIAPQHPLSKKTGDHHFPRTLVRQMDDFF